jgi:hypothetical protein
MNRRDFMRFGTGAMAAGSLGRWSSGAIGQVQSDATGPSGTDIRGGPPLAGEALTQRLHGYLDDLCQWIMTLDLGSNSLKNTKDENTSIFVNGNLARVLMAMHRIKGNPAYRDEALRWCDTFCKIQQRTTTPTGGEAGFWPDVGPRGNIYFGDAGTAATALAVGYHLADEPRRPIYLKAMERNSRFVIEGCQKDPQGLGRDASKGWVIAEGPDKGALGCGYYRGHLSLKPYTIATATTGVAFFSELYAITRDVRYHQVAADATRWLTRIRQGDGELPYLLDGGQLKDWPLDTLSYCVEAFVAADMHLNDADLHKHLGKELQQTVRWLLGRQKPDGSWGGLRSGDQRRSPRSVTLLTWAYRRVQADPKIADSVRRYCQYLLDRKDSAAYGVKELVITSGFVGLTVADMINPGCTF